MAIACITNVAEYLWFLLLVIPMIVDGVAQLIFKAESNNARRFITGLLGGIAIIYLFISIHKFTVWWVTLFLKNIK